MSNYSTWILKLFLLILHFTVYAISLFRLQRFNPSNVCTAFQHLGALGLKLFHKSKKKKNREERLGKSVSFFLFFHLSFSPRGFPRLKCRRISKRGVYSSFWWQLLLTTKFFFEFSSNLKATYLNSQKRVDALKRTPGYNKHFPFHSFIQIWQRPELGKIFFFHKFIRSCEFQPAL